MQKLTDDIIYLFEKQGFVIVSTLDPEGKIHCAAKGIVGIEKKGKVYLIDLYQANTFNNLKVNPTISITSVDEDQFTGFTLKGKARIIKRDKIKDHIIESWEQRVIQRISKRVVRNVQESRSGSHHPEALFPRPQYLIKIEVEEIINLTPTQLKRQIQRKED